jgi:hypothetical protein
MSEKLSVPAGHPSMRAAGRVVLKGEGMIEKR